MGFTILAACPATGARAGVLATTHGDIPTPAFMPVGTQATIKTLTPRDARQSGASCILANAYHLALRPGAEIIASFGGLHRFMGWQGPILTDSGGFQVFSLAELRETAEWGVRFLSHLDRREIELTPERVIAVEELLGADIIMPLDICLGADANESQAAAALERTYRWAVRSQAAHRRADQLLFGIVQGGMSPRLRREAARSLRNLEFPGYAIGGLSVGEPREQTHTLLATVTAELPLDRPRYLMGVGTPEQLLEYIALGVDLFDCVLPTRLGRTGLAFTAEGRLNLRRAEYLADARPIDPSCDCQACARYSRAFIHNALRQRVALGARLLTLHNVRVLIRTAESARRAILEGGFPTLLRRAGVEERWPSKLIGTEEPSPAEAEVA